MKKKQVLKEKKNEVSCAEWIRCNIRWRIRRINEAKYDDDDMACIEWAYFWIKHSITKDSITIRAMKNFRRYLIRKKIREDAGAKKRYEDWVKEIRYE